MGLAGRELEGKDLCVCVCVWLGLACDTSSGHVAAYMAFLASDLDTHSLSNTTAELPLLLPAWGAQ